MAHFQGSCHCGAVKYSADLDLEKPVIACNCSMCGRAGTYLTFVPADEFKLLSGEGDLTDYQFNKKHIHHLFCSTCGVKSFARGSKPDGSQMVAINARCLDDIELGELKVTAFDGKSA
jgi:hypothetical protein